LLILVAFVSGGLAALADEKSEPIAPSEPIRLFNGTDLTNWYTWLSDTKREDPRGVFTVADGLLHISGDGLGGITTTRQYRDYRLVAEYKWGSKTLGKRAARAKDSGILIHCIGPDGSHSGAWPASFEAQIIQGGVGDFIVVSGKYEDGSAVPMTLTAESIKDRDDEDVWHRGGQPATITKGRMNWFGRDPDWADVLGFRGLKDVDSPDEQWTTMEVICDGDKITNIVNGVVVNEAYDVWPAGGKILVQTELAEIFFRRIDLLPLSK
jgi:hypothetical protein